MSVPPVRNPFVPGMMVPRWVQTVIQGHFKLLLKAAACRLVDWFDALTGRSDALTPPAHLRVRVGCFLSFVRIERYRTVGWEFANHLRVLANLKPNGRMLDVGCGCGQVASALAGFLSGEYHGIDPDREAIAWCRSSFNGRLANFHFQCTDFHNGYYNPRGTIHPADWVAPFAAKSFDAILLKSVFTHILKPAMDRYLVEIARVLKRNGRCLVSAYVLNSKTEEALQNGTADFSLDFPTEGGRVHDPLMPEYILGWHEETLRRSAAEANLTIVEPIHYGSWSGHSGALSYQDLLIFERRV